jgi:hypothetical protein
MSSSALILAGVAVVMAVGAAVFRLLFGASQVAALAALGRLPRLPKAWRSFLLGERGNRA